MSQDYYDKDGHKQRGYFFRETPGLRYICHTCMNIIENTRVVITEKTNDKIANENIINRIFLESPILNFKGTKEHAFLWTCNEKGI
jgi:hypothetical protein